MVIKTSAGGTLASTAAVDVGDDVIFTAGDDSDIAYVLRTATLNADTVLTGVLVGTPVSPALAANSLILSNVTDGGDFLLATRRGANSETFLHMDASVGALYLTPVQGGLTISLAADAPAPDQAGVHIWSSTAGAATAVSGTLLTLESSGSSFLTFLCGNTVAGGIVVGDAESDAIAKIIYQNAGSPSNRWEFVANANVAMVLAYGAGPGTLFGGSSNYLRIGDAATASTVDSEDDLFVSGEFETKKLFVSDATGVIQRMAYAQIMEILGDVAFFFPMTDATGSTVTDYSPNGHDGTTSSAVEGWDTPPAYQGSIQVYDANGTDEEFDVADHADFSTAGAMSVIALVKLTTSANSTIVGVWDANSKREWRLYFDASGYPTFAAWDEGNAAQIGRQDQTDIGTASYHTVIATFDGAAISAGITIYVDGVALDDANVEAGSGYANQVDSAAALDVFFNEDGASAPENFYDGTASLIAMTKKELSADEAWNIHQICRGLANF